MDTKANVIVICDLPVVAWGLRGVMDAHAGQMELVAAVASASEAARWIEPDHTYVALLDLDGGNSIDQIPVLLSGSNVRVLTLSTTEDTELQDKAILAGACGVISKREPVEMLCKAILKVHGGEYWVDRAATKRILMAVAREKRGIDPEQEKIARLTRKEKQTIAIITLESNASTLEIAERLNISEHTLRNHLTSIYAKLGVRNRMGLYAYAREYALAE